jgi:signal transduction histidine kinase
VGQTLTALRMELGVVDRLRNAGDADVPAHLDEAKSLSEQALNAVRDIAVGLRPSVLDLGLGPALQWQARQFTKRTGIEVVAQVDHAVPALRDDYATCIYRIVQEALTNSMRHSGANRVGVAVNWQDSGLETIISDDGTGLHDGDKGRGLGLVGMEERARELGGTVAFESAAGKGTTIRVHLPLDGGAAT